MNAVTNSDPAVEEVEFRAFRGTQRSATYRARILDAHALSQMVETAAREHLRVLAQLRPDRPTELDPAAARELASELSELRAPALLLDLDADLVALAEVANWCARSREKASLRIASR